MGKRRERRIAAGRRVKLDIFAERSGEKESSSMHDEVGKDQNGDHNDGVQTHRLPQAYGRFLKDIVAILVGKKQENPLSLLEQYSDDESDDVVLEQHNNAGVDSSPTKPNVKADAYSDVGEDLKHCSDSGATAGKNEQCADEAGKNLDFNNRTGVQQIENERSQVSTSEASETSTNKERAGVWKVLMDEQTNRYYFWNTLTGETSWDIPSDISLTAQQQHISSESEERTDSLVDANTSVKLDPAYGANSDASASDLIVDVIPNSGIASYGFQIGMVKGSESGLHLFYDSNKLLTNYNIHENGVLYGGSATMAEVVALQQSDILLANTDTSVYGCTETGIVDVHSARLVNYGESLLQRLELIARSGNLLAGHEAIRKEIEIRISDCRALYSYGSSLIPFWLHTETQLKLLDSTIAKEEAIQVMQSEDLSELEPPAQFTPRDEKCQSRVVDPGSNPLTTGKDTSSGVSEEDSSYVAIAEDSKDSKAAGEILRASECQLASGFESHTEDMDIDVEMEVDEDTVYREGKELIDSQVPLPKEENPPPLDEEWIPPPPESEPTPPPPPPEEPSELIPPPLEELPASSYSLEETVPPQPYQESYNLAYNATGYNYYASTSGEVATTNYCGNAGGLQFADPSQTIVYQTVSSNAYPEVASTSVNGAHQITDYGAGCTSTAALASCFGYYIESGPISHNGNVLWHSGSTETRLESSSNSGFIAKPAVRSSVTVEGKASDTKTLGVQVTETSLANGGTGNIMPVPVPKNQPKVVHGKKRTVATTTFRSNKKVSSLVDKWKAAKEELHEQETGEPEDPYELLERKRQKAIEEWHARQISSGEAQDNANFIPLGGDWYERVKRRREAKGVEVHSPPQESPQDERDKKQPDLVELSKDLPPGWQAYWDETSKDIYYGNTITSESTWIRPSR